MLHLARRPLQAIGGKATIFPIQKDAIETFLLGSIADFTQGWLGFRRSVGRKDFLDSLFPRRITDITQSRLGFWSTIGRKHFFDSLSGIVLGSLRRWIRFGTVGIMVSCQGSCRMRQRTTRCHKGKRCRGTKKKKQGGCSALHDEKNSAERIVWWPKGRYSTTTTTS